MSPKFMGIDVGDARGFCEVLLASKLVPSDDLAALLGEYCRTVPSAASRSERGLSEFLISRSVITPWQADKLRQRRYKRFFVDQYLLLDHVSAGVEYSTFAALDTTTKSRVLLDIWPPVPPRDRYSGLRYRVRQS